MSQFEEKQIEREEIFDGAVLHVVKDKILLPGILDKKLPQSRFCLGLIRNVSIYIDALC